MCIFFSVSFFYTSLTACENSYFLGADSNLRLTHSYLHWRSSSLTVILVDLFLFAVTFLFFFFLVWISFTFTYWTCVPFRDCRCVWEWVIFRNKFPCVFSFFISFSSFLSHLFSCICLFNISEYHWKTILTRWSVLQDVESCLVEELTNVCCICLRLAVK